MDQHQDWMNNPPGEPMSQWCIQCGRSDTPYLCKDCHDILNAAPCPDCAVKDAEIERLRAGLESAQYERDGYRTANESARVCEDHTSEFIGNGCLVCDNLALRAVVEAARRCANDGCGDARIDALEEGTRTSWCSDRSDDRDSWCWSCQMRAALAALDGEE